MGFKVNCLANLIVAFPYVIIITLLRLLITVRTRNKKQVASPFNRVIVIKIIIPNLVTRLN